VNTLTVRGVQNRSLSIRAILCRERAGCGMEVRVLRYERPHRLSLSAALASVLMLPGCVAINGVFRGVNDALLTKSQRIDYEYEAKFGVEDPQFRRSIDSIADCMVDGNTAELLHNGDQIFAAYVADIDAATTTVNLETFLFGDDRAGKIIADALSRAAARGVEVRLLVDDWGEDLGDLADSMEESGVKVEKYRPIHLYTLRRPGIRTHRKLLIVDGRVGFTGGLGIDERWLGNARNPDEWRETQVRVTGPVVAQLQAVFAENWTFTTAEILAGDAFYPELSPTGTIAAHAIRSSAGDSSSVPKAMYIMAIHSAQKYIHIQNSYFIPDDQVREALVEAARRGVNVEVVVPGKHNDLPVLRQASRFHYGELLEGGVRIFEYEPTMIHNKTVVVDDMFSTIGSINFDARSMQINAEESLSFWDRSFAQQMEAMYQEDKLRCREITYESWRRRGPRKRATELVSWIWEPFY
jgi:cardiolipin synthase A/B